jgi:hypothetical protein
VIIFPAAKKKSNPERAARVDASQMALAMVEKIIGGKLSNRMGGDQNSGQ